MLTFLCLSIISVATIGFFYHRGLHYLRCFHSEEYNEKRLIDWLIVNQVFDRKGSLIALIAAGVSKYIANVDGIGLEICVVAAVALAALCFFEPDPRQLLSIDRQVGSRMKRIQAISMLLYSVVTIGVMFSWYAFHLVVRIPWCWLAAIVLMQSSPIWIVLANRIDLKLRG